MRLKNTRLKLRQIKKQLSKTILTTVTLGLSLYPIGERPSVTVVSIVLLNCFLIWIK
jgi:hypothetical protein